MVIPHVKSIHNDGMSSGKNSWTSASNACVLAMDLSLVCDHIYFDQSTNIAQVFTYDDHVRLPDLHNKPHSTATAPTNDVIKDVVSKMMEISPDAELEDMTEAHCFATEKAEKLAKGQCQEIALLLNSQCESDLHVAQEN